MKRMKYWLLLSLALFAVLCGLPQTADAAIKLNKKSAYLIAGKKLQLKVTGTKKTVKWSSSSSKIASVTKKGLVTGKKKGTATITAKVSSKRLKCKITVEAPTISETSLYLWPDESAQLKVTGTKQKVKWSSSDNDVVTVSSKGLVTAVEEGEAVVSAKIGTSGTLTCEITVFSEDDEDDDGENDSDYEGDGEYDDEWEDDSKWEDDWDDDYDYGDGDDWWKEKEEVIPDKPITKIELDKTSIELTEGDSSQLTCTYSPLDTTDDTTVYWTSSNSTVATVNNSGLVTGKSAGSAVITAMIGKKQATCTVVVTRPLQNYYKQLKDYIKTNGILNDDGDRLIRGTDTYEDTVYSWAIVYESAGDKLHFIHLSETTDHNTRGSLEMYVDVVNNPYVDPSVILLFTDLNEGYSAKAHIRADAYNGEDDVYFSLTSATDFFKTYNIQEYSNAALRLACSGWNTLLQNRVGISLKDLGFTSYRQQ